MQILEGKVKIVNVFEHYATKHNLKSEKLLWLENFSRKLWNNCRCDVSSVKFIHGLMNMLSNFRIGDLFGIRRLIRCENYGNMHGHGRHLMDDCGMNTKRRAPKKGQNGNQFRCAKIELNLLHEAESGKWGWERGIGRKKPAVHGRDLLDWKRDTFHVTF